MDAEVSRGVGPGAIVHADDRASLSAPFSPRLSRRGFLAAGASLAAVAALPRPAAAAPVTGVRLFGCTELRLAHSGSVPAWRAALGRHAAQNASDYSLCPARLRFLASSCGDRRWAETAAAPRPAAGRDLLAWVNERINREPAMPDAALWQMSDYWATPREFLVLGGDCEDYAVAKFLLLRLAGWPADALRLVVTQDRRQGGHHAVLLARDGDEGAVLDNLHETLIDHADCPH